MEIKINFLIVGLTAIIPLITGAIWYNPKICGKAWMESNGFDEAKLKENFNMPLVFGLTLLLGFFLAFGLTSVVIHQMGFFAMLMNHVSDAETQQLFKDVMAKYGGEFRSFKHGALHGSISAITLALPVLGINALFERKGLKYIGIHLGYWILTLLIMGGIICQFA
jgi:hypothetical protein